mmetsp:Transcript_41411/g.75025  ORF Transcript_41411/g.75025 Transcript_41411/m.75025 type:complete len:493 (+) Transcript_41411:100-1578(+)
MAGDSRERPPLEPSGCMGMDIGGSLVKFVFLELQETPAWCDASVQTALQKIAEEGKSLWQYDAQLSFFDDKLKGTLHFLSFESTIVEEAVNKFRQLGVHSKLSKIHTAGGGAYKYAELFQKLLGIELVAVDELAVVVRGISWMAEKRWLKEIYGLGAVASTGNMQELQTVNRIKRYLDPRHDELFPLLLVNIGSGVSIVRVDSPVQFARVSGTALGGGTYWGLARLLTGCETWEEATQLAAKGKANLVNLTVADIYGGDYKLSTGAVLPGNLVASFFARASHEENAADTGAILRALTVMIAQNICQISALQARLQGTTRVLFTGNFLRQNALAQQTIAAQMERVTFSSQRDGKGLHCQAFFLEHEGYFGAIGSLLHEAEPQERVHVPPSTRVRRRVDGSSRHAYRSATAPTLDLDGRTYGRQRSLESTFSEESETEARNYRPTPTGRKLEEGLPLVQRQTQARSSFIHGVIVGALLTGALALLLSCRSKRAP